MQGYTVKELARIAGVSVRTLHHYDHIGLLKPDARTGAGYRLYGAEQRLRLQQILFFKELDVPLQDISRILEEPGFDPLQALLDHRKQLEERMEKLQRLLDTLDKTVEHYQGGPMLTDEEMYSGFEPEKVATMRKEARELYGEEVVEQSERKVRKLSKEALQAIHNEGDTLTRDLVALMTKDPGDPAVQAVVVRHQAWVSHFWTPDAVSYRGLGRMYTEHAEFKAYYEKYAPGLADFLCRAIERYCDAFPEP